MDSPCAAIPGGLLCMLIISVSGTLYVQSGSDITDCNMKCPGDDEMTLELYRECRGEDRTLLERHCYYNHTKSHDPRLRLHTGSGCWKLTNARKDDSCVYNVWCHCDPGYVMSSTEIRVLDPVLISNISSNFSRLGEEMAVSVQFSGEESAVTWEEDGEPLPERYRLIDDKRTLIIPGVQRDNAERRFRVRITNPVSEEIQEYRLINDPMFIRMLETEDPDSHRGRPGVIVVLAVAVMISVTWICSRRNKRILQTEYLEEKKTFLPIMGNGAVTTMGNGAATTMGSGAAPTTGSGAAPTTGSGAAPTTEEY